jgi:hypothetical protein
VNLLESKVLPFFNKEAVNTSPEFQDFLTKNIEEYDSIQAVKHDKIQNDNQQLDQDIA